jgi:MFS family permease
MKSAAGASVPCALVRGAGQQRRHLDAEVGAQWLVVHEPDAATWVSLVQAGTTLPVLLFALPSGALADTVDRRRLLIGVQGSLFLIATGLAVLTALGPIGLLVPSSVWCCWWSRWCRSRWWSRRRWSPPGWRGGLDAGGGL